MLFLCSLQARAASVNVRLCRQIFSFLSASELTGRARQLQFLVHQTVSDWCQSKPGQGWRLTKSPPAPCFHALLANRFQTRHCPFTLTTSKFVPQIETPDALVLNF
ncbi:hypothetical protein BaRGS_00023766 [Batillaria attramentaria]|uniref:Secreted protein n=1 Tax=Batillaria attramentaria TaxID=370345 RepID=A0ABD0KCW3_9CAEN